MSYFVPVSTTVRDHFLDFDSIKYMRVVIDPSGTPSTFTPVSISCDASEDYERWSFSVKNRSGLSVGLYANDDVTVQVSHNNTDWVTIFTGFVSDEGIRRTRGMVTDDFLFLDLVNATKRKGTKRKPDESLLSNFTTVDTTTTASSILHYLAGLMGVSVETSDITQTHELVRIGDDTAWSELQALKEAFHADMYFRYDGKLLFRSPLEDSYSAPSSEWTFQGDPDNAVSGDACRIVGKLQEAYLPVRCNYAKTSFDDYDLLSNRVIYKNTENYSSDTDVISIEVGAGEYWPGPNAGDVAKLMYSDPDSGEEYPFAINIDTPTIGATGSGNDIEYTGGTLVLTSFNGSTSATVQGSDHAQIILQNTGATTCTIRKLTITGEPYSKISDVIVEHVDSAVSDAIDFVQQEINGKYMIDSSQAFDTMYHIVEEGKGRPRSFSFDAPFLPWIQRRAIVMVQPPDEVAVRCVIDTYRHSNRGRTLQGMRTTITCTELGTYTPTGNPYVSTSPSIPAWQAKLTSISDNASATYRTASTSAPTNPQIGDYWYQTDTNLTKRYAGSVDGWQNVGASPLTASSDPGVSFSNASGLAKILEDGSMTLTDLYAENATVYGRLFHEAIETQDAVSTGSEVTFDSPTHWSGADAYDALTGVTEDGGLINGAGTLDTESISKLARLASGGYLTLGTGSGSDNFTSLTLLAIYTIPTYASSFYISISVNDAQVSVTKNTTNANDYFLRKTGSSGSANTTISVVAGDVIRIYGSKIITIGSASWSYQARTETFSGKGLFVGLATGYSSYFLYDSFYTELLSTTSPNTFDSTANDTYASSSSFIAGVASEPISVLRLVTQSTPASLLTYGAYTDEPIIGVMRTASGILVYMDGDSVEFLSGGYYEASGSYEILSQTKGVLIDNIKPMESTSSVGESGNPFYAGYFDNLNLDGISMYACRAWVNFDGTGVFSPNPSEPDDGQIRASGNISSVEDKGTGLYKIKFENSMPDANYAVVAMSRGTDSSENSQENVSLTYRYTPTVNDFEISNAYNGGPSNYDTTIMSVAVFR